MTDALKVDFDYTLDEAVDVQLHTVRQTREGASWRRREQWRFVCGVVLASMAVIFLSSSERSPATFVAMFAISVVIGLALVVPFGHFYDHRARARIRRLLVERFGDGPYHCSIEIRPAGLWSAQQGVESQFPWSQATKTEDTPEGVDVVFKGGRVLARSRGFASAEHRSMFVQELRDRVSAATAADP
jgi:hypothetical protein